MSNNFSDVEDEFDVSSGVDKESENDKNNSSENDEYDIEEYDEEVEIEVDEDFDENQLEDGYQIKSVIEVEPKK